MGRTCESCGVKIPPYKPRTRSWDGSLLCDGCHPDKKGSPGRPIDVHSSLHCDACLAPMGDAGMVVTAGKITCAAGCKTATDQQRHIFDTWPLTRDPKDGWAVGCDCGWMDEGPYPTQQAALDAAHSGPHGNQYTGSRKTAGWTEPVPDESWYIEVEGVGEATVSADWDNGYDTPSGYTYDAFNYDTLPARTEGKTTSLDEAKSLCERAINAKAASLRKKAHDSGDGATIYHCPFCGAGQVTARSDGTVECGFCDNYFTVQVQPNHAAMPQTDPTTGKPLNMPGMPGDPATHQAPTPAPMPEDPGFAPEGTGGDEGFAPAGTKGAQFLPAGTGNHVRAASRKVAEAERDDEYSLGGRGAYGNDRGYATIKLHHNSCPSIQGKASRPVMKNYAIDGSTARDATIDHARKALAGVSQYSVCNRCKPHERLGLTSQSSRKVAWDKDEWDETQEDHDHEDCTTCGGSGELSNGKECDQCDGSGREPNRRKASKTAGLPDTPAITYGMSYDPRNASRPEVREAKAYDGWDSIPLITIGPDEPIHATEAMLSSKSINKVVNGNQAFRTGYDPHLVRTDEGLFVVDGHHRVAMNKILGAPMKAHVLDLTQAKAASKTALYLTPDGVAIPEKSYLASLALRFADDRAAVLTQIRSERTVR